MILGREYTKGSTIPAFDAQADTDHDGYLNNAEYAKRRSGYDARFVYESRLFYPNYGPMRFATNVSDANFRNSPYMRLKTIERHIEQGRLQTDLYWVARPRASASPA